MAKKNNIQSIEPKIAGIGNGWLKQYGLKYCLEQEHLNNEIDTALQEYSSKKGGTGGNRPDTKLLITDKNSNAYPVLIEYKGYKDALEKLDEDNRVANTNKKNEPDYKNISSYAVNGAIHYANAILHYTNYTEIIAIGMTGYENSIGEVEHSIGVYYVSKSNLGVGQKVGEYLDFSFLEERYFDKFIEKAKNLQLSSEEIDKIKEKKEREIDISLTNLNNDIYQNEKGLSESDRVYLVAASIIATIGIPGKVYPLEKADLKSSLEDGNRDGDIILRKIKAFLKEKNLPDGKKDLIIRTLQNTLLSDNINRAENGESQLKRVFTKIVDDLGIYYKIGLTTDFTGKLFNEMYSWLGFTQDKLNDVVLTPSYVATLLVKLARVNRDSYVWDFATGSAGLLVAAMNEMLIDAKKNINSPEELAKKSIEIKAKQLLGLEILPNIYMLAILNMILMGDGSSNILNKNSLKDFNGNYGFGNITQAFPATAFVLNPPYSAEGNGMIFVEKALSMMNKGYAAIIIQSSAGNGKATIYNKKILEKNTLLASIKMPIDLFIGKSSVQTQVYVFRVGEAHQKDDIVKFIDFSNDGYTRTNRKKASCNLKDTDHAKERYQEIVDLVRFGKNKLNFFTEKEYYEGTINPKSGMDWNQTAPIDTKPILKDFKKTVSGYLAWEVSNLLKNQNNKDECLEKINTSLKEKLNNVEWSKYKIGDLFEKAEVIPLKYKTSELPSTPTGKYVLPALTAGIQNQGLNNYVPTTNATILKNIISISANGANTGATFYQSKEFTVLQDSYAIYWKNTSEILSDNQYLFLVGVISKTIYGNYEWTNKAGWNKVKYEQINLPTQNGKIDFDFMESFIAELEAEHIAELEAERIAELEAYLYVSGLDNYKLSIEEKNNRFFQ